MNKASRQVLDRWADVLGTKRKWFGLESNQQLRKRLIGIMIESDKDVQIRYMTLQSESMRRFLEGNGDD